MILKDYLKAVKANKFTLASYGLLAAHVAGIVADVRSDTFDINFGINFLTFLPYAIGLVSTGAGEHTLRAYCQARDIIKNNNGGLRGEVINDYESGLYCTRAGIRLAVREAGLEDTFKASI